MARSAQDARATTEVERPAQPRRAKRHKREWLWLGIASVCGALLGALILGVLAYATSESGPYLNRGGFAILGALVGFFVGLIAGFVLWALWVLLRTFIRSEH